MAEVNIEQDLAQINTQLEQYVTQLNQLNAQKNQLEQQIHNLNGIAMYLRGKQDPEQNPSPEISMNGTGDFVTSEVEEES